MPPSALFVVPLWSLLALFVLRVAGQIVVVLGAPRWLPPMKDWYSGLMPYRYLLPSQIAIIALMTSICVGFSTTTSVFVQKGARVGVALLAFSAIYAASMVVRYVVRARRYPDLRWYEGGTIPIIFHFVLAGFLATLGVWHAF